MCQFFSLISKGDGKPLYFDAKQRSKIKTGRLKDTSGHRYDPDSHSSIVDHYGVKAYNAYEYNPFTKSFRIDRHNENCKDDSQSIHSFCDKLNFRTIIPDFVRKVKFPQRPKQPRKRVSKSDMLLFRDFVLNRYHFYTNTLTEKLYSYSTRSFKSYQFGLAVTKGFLYPKRQAKAVKAACELYKRGFTVRERYYWNSPNKWQLLNKNGKIVKKITYAELEKIE